MGWVSTAIADEVSTAVTSAWTVPFARAIPSAQSRALVMLWLRLPGWRRRPRFRARPCRGTSASRRTAARPRRARGGSSRPSCRRRTPRRSQPGVEAAFRCTRPVRRSRRPVIDVSVVAAESVDGSHRGHEPCKVARNARLEDEQPPRLAGVLTRLLAPTRPPNKCARPSPWEGVSSQNRSRTPSGRPCSRRQTGQTTRLRTRSDLGRWCRRASGRPSRGRAGGHCR